MPHKKNDAWFEHWFNSPYYQLLYQQRNQEEADRFMKVFLRHLQLPDKAIVLDAGCGTGRYSWSLAKHHLDVIGIDINSGNIKQSNRHHIENLTFYVHDMRQLFYINYFDAVFNLFTSFGYFETEKEQIKAFRTLAASLKKGGKLVIDFLNCHYVMRNLPGDEIITFGNIVFHIKKFREDKTIIKKIAVSDSGAVYEFEERVQALTIQDFERYLYQFNMQLVEVFGDYNLNEFNADTSERLILIAEKK